MRSTDVSFEEYLVCTLPSCRVAGNSSQLVDSEPGPLHTAYAVYCRARRCTEGKHYTTRECKLYPERQIKSRLRSKYRFHLREKICRAVACCRRQLQVYQTAGDKPPPYCAKLTHLTQAQRIKQKTPNEVSALI